MLKAIVFDFDGVLVNSEPLHYRAFVRVLEPLGLTFTYEQYLDDLVGYDDRDLFRVTLGKPAGRPADAATEAKIAALIRDKAVAFEAVVNEGVEETPGMRRLVESAARELPIAISSGAWRRDIDLVLGRLDLLKWFDRIVAADHVQRSKPDPESYALAAQAVAAARPDLRIQAGDCLAIEDTAAGIESARGAGLMTLGLASTGPAQKLRHANRVIQTVEGLTLATLREWYG